jgi:hypothetical protein
MEATALFDFAPKHAGAIPLNRGDHVTVLTASPVSGWQYVRHAATGAEGYVPANRLKLELQLFEWISPETALQVWLRSRRSAGHAGLPRWLQGSTSPVAEFESFFSLCYRGEGRWGYPSLHGTRFAPHTKAWLGALKMLARRYAAAHFGAWPEGFVVHARPQRAATWKGPAIPNWDGRDLNPVQAFKAIRAIQGEATGNAPLACVGVEKVHRAMLLKGVRFDVGHRRILVQELELEVASCGATGKGRRRTTIMKDTRTKIARVTGGE